MSSSSCVDRSFGLLPKDAQLNNIKNNDIIATKRLVACEIKATEVTADNLNVATINNLPVSSSSSSCSCETSEYIPPIISETGFAVNPFPATVTRIDKVITVSGIMVATNTGANLWATAELGLPIAFPVGPSSYIRGSGSYWNQNVNVVTGIVLPVHVQAVSATSFRVCVNQLLTDGALTYMFQYQIA